MTQDSKQNNRQSKKTGLPPGALVYVGEKKSKSVEINVLDYSAEECKEQSGVKVDSLGTYTGPDTATWIDFDGVHDLDLIKQAGALFELHPLVLEDIVNTRQRPKSEDYGDYVFFTLKMVDYVTSSQRMTMEQVSFIFGNNTVLSFQEHPGDIFEPIRDRIRNGKGKVRGRKADYLVFLLIDAVVDRYFFTTEQLGDRIELLESLVLDGGSTDVLQRIQKLRKDLSKLRRAVYPLREAVSSLLKEEASFIEPATEKYFRNVYDHIVQVLDSIETHRELASSLKDLYISEVSNRTNNIMKVLTIMASIFIPLTFIAGIYGMNFEYMPELKSAYGYPIVWGIMLAVVGGMLYYFKRKDWL